MTREVQLTQRMVALVDDADFETVMDAGRWHAHRAGRLFYARRNTWQDGRSITVRLHTFLTGWPLVDHINGDGLDNRRSNLRAATAQENARNRGRRTTSVSGYKGVSWHKASARWQASIGVGDRRWKHLGYFSDSADAARAYDAAAINIFGPYARPNFPQETAA